MGEHWWVPLLALLVPALAGILILARGTDPGRGTQVRVLCLLAALAAPLSVFWLWVSDAGMVIVLAPAMRIHLALDPMGILFAGLASVLWIVTVIYSLGYMDPKKSTDGAFFGYLILAQSAVIGIALARNMLTLYLFYEALTFLTYPLVTHKGVPPAARAGRLYISYSLLGAALVLAGMVGLQSTYGDLLFTPGGALTGVDLSHPGLVPMFLLLVLGFGVKAALMPVHGWLPRAMVAPTPVSALLHAVAVVKAGVFGILRTVYGIYGVSVLSTLGVAAVLTAMSLITIVIASLLALRQDHLKARLAYSTVAQLSYIILGASLLSPAGLGGALLHLVNHALLKVILFFSAGVIMSQSGIEHVSGMSGVFRRFPVTMTAFTVASLGLIGILPTNGFPGKWHLITASLESGQILPALALGLSALASALYLLPVPIKASLAPAPFRGAGGLEAPRSMVYPIACLAVLAVMVGLFPGPLLSLTSWAAGSMLGFPVNLGF